MITYSLARRSLVAGELVEAQDRLRGDQEADAVGLLGEHQHQDHQPLEPADQPAALRQAGVAGVGRAASGRHQRPDRIAAGPDRGDQAGAERHRRRQPASPASGPGPQDRPRAPPHRRPGRAPRRARSSPSAPPGRGEGGEAVAAEAQLQPSRWRSGWRRSAGAAPGWARSRAPPSSPRRRWRRAASSTAGRAFVADHGVGLQHEVGEEVPEGRGRRRFQACGGRSARASVMRRSRMFGPDAEGVLPGPQRPPDRRRAGAAAAGRRPPAAKCRAGRRVCCSSGCRVQVERGRLGLLAGPAARESRREARR